MVSNELRVLCVLLSIALSSSFLSKGFQYTRSSDLSSVKRRPDRFTEWEVRKKGDNNQQKNSTSTSAATKSSLYRNAIADSNRIADTTSLTNRRVKPSQAPNAVVDVTKHQDYETGLVIERLGGSLLVEVISKNGSLPFNVVCYQRSSLSDSQIVVGDTVDLLVVMPTAGNATMIDGSDDDGSDTDIIDRNTSELGIHSEEIGTSLTNTTATNLPLTATDVANSILSSEEVVISDISTEHALGDSINDMSEHSSEEVSEHSSPEDTPEDSSVPIAVPLQGVVLKHHERLNLLQRPSPFNSGSNAKNKAIAANIDQIVLVVSAIPVVPLSSIDRILVAAHEYDMDAIILLNKMDLEGSEELFENLKHYERMGYPLLRVSVKTKEGLQELRDTLKDKCSVFVGQSGIGKSSLVNTLLPDADYKAKIGALVRSANLGAHTTSSARLFHIPEGGRIIDSPGIRELGLWHLSESSIKAGFREIDALTKKCKFRNCRHTEDTLGCAVQQGVRDGVVHPDRLESYFTFLE